MAARRRIRLGLPGLLALLALLFLCADARAAVDFSYGPAVRTQVQPGDTVLLYTGPAATAADAKSAAAALVRERAYYEAQGAQVFAFGLGGLHPDAPEAACTAIAPDAAALGMGVAALAERGAQAGFDILCCNLTTAAGEAVFLPGKLYGDVGVLAFTDPAALTGLPAQERAAYDMNGEVARVLIEYAAAQLRAEGAATTVLLAVCPVEEAGRPWRGEDLRMQCTGIDVWIEAHSPEGAAQGPVAEGLVLYAAPGQTGMLRIPGTVQASPAEPAGPAETAQPAGAPRPARTSAAAARSPEPTQTVRPIKTAQPAQTIQPVQASRPTLAPRPTQTVSPVKTAGPAEAAQPIKTLQPTLAPAAYSETPYSAAETAGIPSSGSPAQTPPRSPGEEEARRALALEEGQRRQDYIPPNAVYTGDAPHSPLLFAAGALCFACARTLGRKRGGRA